MAQPARTAEPTPPIVLVVDDDAPSRAMMRMGLVRAGFRVEEAADGQEALAAFERCRPDVVLLDVLMPVLDGHATCRALRGLPGGEHAPIVMMTAVDDVESIHAAFEAGATDFFPKPVRPAVLGYRVRYLLRAGDAFRALQRTHDRLARALEPARLGHWEHNLVTGEFQCSSGVASVLGRSNGSSPSSYASLFAGIHPEDLPEVEARLQSAREAGVPHNVTYRIGLSDGSERHILNQGEVVVGDTGEPEVLMGTVQDVTEFLQAEAQVRAAVLSDALTGLGNRSMFHAQLKRALHLADRLERPVALLHLDVDRFKRFNDTLGHALGDRLLKEIAVRIGRCVRRSDLISRMQPGAPASSISRLGGDEFAIVLTEMRRPEDAARVAQRIVEEVAVPTTLDQLEVLVTASIGIAVCPNDGVDPETLMRNAESAMYSAKESGRNGYRFYEASMNADASDRLALEAELRNAIARDELVLHFQPKVDANTGRIVGGEALVRWQHPTRGLMYPGAFISVAEESGLIIALNEWVLRAACRQNHAWQQAGLPEVRIAVNLSGSELGPQNAAVELARVIRESGLDPRWIEIEITEDVIMNREAVTVDAMRHLKSLGVRIAIDDFGTGYSSLAYLKTFPVDTLKIDRSFIIDLHTDASDMAITRAIVAMAHSLHLAVVAEGVETTDQLAILRALGCDEIQGYLFSRPVAAPAFAELLRAGRICLDGADG